METIIQQKVIEVANTVEKQLDAELERLDNLDINDIEKLRENRLQELKKLQKQKQDWLSLVLVTLTRIILFSSYCINNIFLFYIYFRVMENIQKYQMKRNSLKFPRNLRILFAYFIKMIHQDVKL